MESSVHEHRLRVCRELVILQGHSNEEKGQLLNLPKHPGLVLVTLGIEALLDQVDVGLVDVISGDEVHLKLKELQEFHLAGQDLLLRESSVRDFLRDYL